MSRLARKPVVEVAGMGSVRFAGRSAPVDYLIRGEPDKLRLDGARLRAALKLPPELAEAAFRSGDAVLTLDDGASYRVAMLGHTEGKGEVFVELRV